MFHHIERNHIIAAAEKNIIKNVIQKKGIAQLTYKKKVIRKVAEQTAVMIEVAIPEFMNSVRGVNDVRDQANQLSLFFDTNREEFTLQISLLAKEGIDFNVNEIEEMGYSIIGDLFFLSSLLTSEFRVNELYKSALNDGSSQVYLKNLSDINAAMSNILNYDYNEPRK